MSQTQSQTLVADCETDGLLDVLTKVHSLCAHVMETDERISSYGDTIEEALKRLMEADELWFHNGIGFDMQALKKVYPWFKLPVAKLRDSLIISRLLSPHLYDLDIRNPNLPKRLRGSHGLEAWGYRLGEHKGDYAKEMEDAGLDPWAEWNPSMQAYCNQDVDVSLKLVQMMKDSGIPERASELEHWFAFICSKMENVGFEFNVNKAEALERELIENIGEIDEKLKGLVDPWYKPDKEFIPKRTQGVYTKDVPLTKIKLVKFNPGSRQHIADRLVKLYGWEPENFTEKGSPKVDEEALLSIDNPIGKILADRFILNKRLSQLKTGSRGWLKLHREGRLYGRINTLGAVTGRCTHSEPNMAQVPSCGALYGKRCRELFIVRPGYKLVGADASALELRCLAHYMAEFDGGAYAEVLLEGDIHTENQEAAGLPTRDNAKTFIYGFLYGAGDAKIGQIVNGTSSDGKMLKENFLNRLPALRKVRDTLMIKAERQGYIEGIDGRKLYVRHSHAVLNTLLQSAGALLVKQATINLFKKLTMDGLQWGKDWAMVAHVHDEFQLEVREDLAQHVAGVAVWSFQQAGRDFDWRCPLDGEAKIGNNWAETH